MWVAWQILLLPAHSPYGAAVGAVAVDGSGGNQQQTTTDGASAIGR